MRLPNQPPKYESHLEQQRSGIIEREFVDTNKRIINVVSDSAAATSVAEADKVLILQGGVQKSATVRQVHDALPIVYYVPTAVTKNVGGTAVGTVAGVQTMLDGTIYEVAEVTGVPGFDIEFTFASVVRTPTEIVLRMWYEGSITHDVHVEIYNYVTPGWNTVHVVADKEDYEVIVLPIPSFANYLSAGAVKIRVYHETSGNSAHDVRFDYVALRAL